MTFPRVTLVGVISADVGLGLADFRASERTFQLLTQVAGRAGRGEGRVRRCADAVSGALQHPAGLPPGLSGVLREARSSIARHMRYPPFVSLVNGVVRGRTVDEAIRHANAIVRGLEPAAARGTFTILGPAPAPLGRLRGEHRVQFLLKGSRRADMRAALLEARRRDARHRAAVDDRCRSGECALSGRSVAVAARLEVQGRPISADGSNRRRREAEDEHHQRERCEPESASCRAACPRRSSRG